MFYIKSTLVQIEIYRLKKWKTTFNVLQPSSKKTEVVILFSDKVDLKSKLVRKGKDYCMAITKWLSEPFNGTSIMFCILAHLTS